MLAVERREHLVASGKAIPTILLTGRPGDDRPRALRASVSRYLSRPFSERELLACINNSTLRDRTVRRGSHEHSPFQFSERSLNALSGAVEGVLGK